jgi:hypothetical protein
MLCVQAHSPIKKTLVEERPYILLQNYPVITVVRTSHRNCQLLGTLKLQLLMDQGGQKKRISEELLLEEKLALNLHES